MTLRSDLIALFTDQLRALVTEWFERMEPQDRTPAQARATAAPTAAHPDPL